MIWFFKNPRDLSLAKDYCQNQGLEFTEGSTGQEEWLRILPQIDEDLLVTSPGFSNGIPASERTHLVSKATKETTIITLKNCSIGGTDPVFIAGPCSVETEANIFEAAQLVKAAGAQILRGGTFKARTSPYDFQGLGKSAVDLLAQAGAAFEIPVATEIIDVRDLEYLTHRVDVLQVGARNMQNFTLLKELGQAKKPVILKRGISATLEEFLMAAEYLLLYGNPDVILCERGIRTYEPSTRNTMDLSAISALRELTHLPVLADPSHGTGVRTLVKPMAYAAMAAGAHGLMIEAHGCPDLAWSDAAQQIPLTDLKEILDQAKKIRI